MITHKPRAKCCYTKTKFHSHSEAARNRRAVRTMKGETMQIYRCTECKYWHLGHKQQ